MKLTTTHTHIPTDPPHTHTHTLTPHINVKCIVSLHLIDFATTHFVTTGITLLITYHGGVIFNAM